MDEKDLEGFLRDVIRENMPVDSELEKNAEDAGRILSAYYAAYMTHGFPEDRAFQMVIFMLGKILEGQKK